MTEQGGRSLIEIIGVMAIGGVMTVGAVGMYNSVRNSQIRNIAATQIEQVAKDVKMLMELRGDYTGVSVEYLIKAGALANANAPIGGAGWSVTSSYDGATFSINLVELTRGECEYFTTAVPKWADTVTVNGFDTEIESHCFSSDTNNISFTTH